MPHPRRCNRRSCAFQRTHLVTLPALQSHEGCSRLLFLLLASCPIPPPSYMPAGDCDPGAAGVGAAAAPGAGAAVAAACAAGKSDAVPCVFSHVVFIVCWFAYRWCPALAHGPSLVCIRGVEVSQCHWPPQESPELKRGEGEGRGEAYSSLFTPF